MRCRPGDRRTHPVMLTLRKQGNRLVFENEGTAPQDGAMNATFSGWRGAIMVANFEKNPKWAGKLISDIAKEEERPPVEIGLERAFGRDMFEARFESKGLAFHQRLRDAFLAIARDEPGRCALIDAGGTLDEVAAQVWTTVAKRLDLEP